MRDTLTNLEHVGIGALYDDGSPVPTTRRAAPPPTPAPAPTGRPASAAGEWRCPRTGGALEPVEVASYHVHVNQTCGGLMVEKGSEDRLLKDRAAWPEVRAFCAALEEAASRAVDGRAVVYMNCPGCGGPMHRKNFGRVSGVLVDSCPSCGTWFDPGELTAALDFLEGDGEARREKFEANERAYAEEQRRVMRRIQARTPRHYGRGFGSGFDLDDF